MTKQGAVFCCFFVTKSFFACGGTSILKSETKKRTNTSSNREYVWRRAEKILQTNQNQLVSSFSRFEKKQYNKSPKMCCRCGRQRSKYGGINTNFRLCWFWSQSIDGCPMTIKQFSPDVQGIYLGMQSAREKGKQLVCENTWKTV